MDDSVVLPPPAETATTEGVAQAVADGIELSPLSTPSTLPAATTQQQSGNPSSPSPNQSRRTSTTWKLLKRSSFRSFHSLGSGTSEFLKRYKTNIYKHSLKILAILCTLGALALAWLNLRSESKPKAIDVQSLAALNRSADSQSAMYEVLQESLGKLQKDLASERQQLEIDRELLRNEVAQLDLQKWTAQRQFIKDCLEYQKVKVCQVLALTNDALILSKDKNMTSTRCADAIKAWDEPPPFWSAETELPQRVRRRPMVSPPSLDSSQTPLILMDEISVRTSRSKHNTQPAPLRTSQESPSLSVPKAPAYTDPDTLPNGPIRDLDRFLTQFMIGFIAFVAVSLVLFYTVRSLWGKSLDKRRNSTRSEKTGPTGSLPFDVDPIVIRSTAISEDLPVGNRHRRATSTQYRKGDIWTAAYSGSLEAIASFRAENRYQNINEISPRLGTPLQAACQGGQLETAKSLLKWGADPYIQGGRFKTCLVAAAYSGNCDVVRLILDRGVPIDEYNVIAGSALHAACERGSAEMVELLVRKGSSVRAGGGSYGTALQAASFRGKS